jgi:hypothetical protein
MRRVCAVLTACDQEGHEGRAHTLTLSRRVSSESLKGRWPVEPGPPLPSSYISCVCVCQVCVACVCVCVASSRRAGGREGKQRGKGSSVCSTPQQTHAPRTQQASKLWR